MVRYDQLHSMFQVHLIYKASTGFGKTQSMPIQWILMFSVNFIFVPKVAAAIISLVNCDQRDFTKRFSDSKKFPTLPLETEGRFVRHSILQDNTSSITAFRVFDDMLLQRNIRSKCSILSVKMLSSKTHCKASTKGFKDHKKLSF